EQCYLSHSYLLRVKFYCILNETPNKMTDVNGQEYNFNSLILCDFLNYCDKNISIPNLNKNNNIISLNCLETLKYLVNTNSEVLKFIALNSESSSRVHPQALAYRFYSLGLSRLPVTTQKQLDSTHL